MAYDRAGETPALAKRRMPSSMARGVLWLILALGLAVPAIGAEVPASPVGLWKTIDDHTNQPRGLVRVYEEDGRFFGRVERSLMPEDAGKTCTACTDERRNQPVVGMVIMRNIRLVDGRYGDGDILDPESGTIYQCEFSLEGDGSRMVVRGYVGISLLGRSQSWLREE